MSSSEASSTRYSLKSFAATAESTGSEWLGKVNVPDAYANEVGSLTVDPETEPSIVGEFECEVLPNRGEETGKLETEFVFVKSVGDSVESDANSGDGLLSGNNNPLSIFALSDLGTR